MNVPLYQQLLAEQYEENARNVLVYQQQYENEDDETGDVEYDSRKNYEDRELPDPDEFNKFQGDRGRPEHVIKPAPTTKQKNSLKRDTDVRNIVLNIDSMFRGTTVPTTITTTVGQEFVPASSSSWFIMATSQIYRNITSVKLTSVEFPNTFYTFSAARGNTTFTLIINPGPGEVVKTVLIPDGNYQTSSTVLTLNPTTLLTAIEDFIQNDLGITGFAVDYDPVSNRTVFNYSQPFSITFPSPTSNPYKNGIGYNIGFYQTTYTSMFTGAAYEIMTDAPADVIQDKYIYLQINDWNLVQHQDINQTSFSAFAKIQLPGTKNTMIFDGNYINSSTKEYFFPQPVNIQRLEIKLLDAFGNVLELGGENWAMTVEFRQVNDSATYEALNEL